MSEVQSTAFIASNTPSEVSLEQAACEARDAILDKHFFQPEVAIVLGSGLSELGSSVENSSSIPYADIPHFSKTHAAGHPGRLILGYLCGVPVVMLQGRVHRYEGHSRRAVELPVHCVHALGARTLITTNAAGGLNTRYRVGDLMVIDSHIDWLWGRREAIEPRQGAAARGKCPYDFDLLLKAQEIARSGNIALHQGCYLATLGPTYETRSEYRMFRWMGADAVGMSTVPEVLAAQRLGMSTLGFSVITNVASTDFPVSTTHDEVVDAGNTAGPRLMKIILGILDEMAGPPD